MKTAWEAATTGARSPALPTALGGLLFFLSFVGCACDGDLPPIDADDDASTPDAWAPPPHPAIPVLVLRTLPDDRLTLLALHDDGSWSAPDDDVILPGIGTDMTVAPSGAHALISYVTTVEGERGVVAIDVQRDPMEISLRQRLPIDGAGDLRYVGFVTEDAAIAVRYGTTEHVIVPLRRSAGAWSASAPIPFPVEWSGPVHGVPAAPGVGLFARRNQRDLRDPTEIFAVDARSEPFVISAPLASIDDIGVLAVHPLRETAYLFTGADVPTGEHQTGRLYALDGSAWSVRGAAVDLPNRAERAAIAPDGSFAAMIEPVVSITADAGTGDPVFTQHGYAIDRVVIDASGGIGAIDPEVARIEGDGIKGFAILEDGRVLVARSIGSGPIEYTILVFDGDSDLTVQGSRIVEGVARIAVAR